MLSPYSSNRIERFITGGFLRFPNNLVRLKTKMSLDDMPDEVFKDMMRIVRKINKEKIKFPVDNFDEVIVDVRRILGEMNQEKIKFPVGNSSNVYNLFGQSIVLGERVSPPPVNRIGSDSSVYPGKIYSLTKAFSGDFRNPIYEYRN